MRDIALTISETSEALQELLGMLQDTGDTSIPKLLARKLQRLLPHIMGRLQDTKDEITIQALMILWKLMGHLPREKASPIAVGLLRDLRPHFDGGCSQLRVLAIRLLQFLLELVLGSDRRRMRSETWDLLLPLFFRMSDQSCSVAEASWEALLAAAKLLGWGELRCLLERRQTWRVAECLVWALHPPLFPLEPLGPLCPSHIRMGKGVLGLLQPMGAFHSIPFPLQL